MTKLRWTLPLLAVGGLLAAEGVPATDRTGNYTLHGVWIESGLGPGVTEGDVGDVEIGGAVFNQSLDGDWRPGLHAGIEWSRTRVDLDGDGWTLGLALWYDRAPGRITAATTASGSSDVDAKVELEILSIAIAPAWAYRFDADALARVAPREWQLEVGPVFALGMAQAQVGSGDPSAWGLCWQAGARARVHTEIARGLRLGAYLGGVWVEARTEWDNTGVATFSGAAPIGGVMLGYEY